MKQNVIRYSMIALLIGLVVLAAGRANAQDTRWNEIIIESFSWGMSTGQTARVSGANFSMADGSVRFLSASIQLLDQEGNVIAQSDEIRIEPNKIGYWDARRETLPAGEHTGRIQVRARIIVVFVTTANQVENGWRSVVR